MTPMKSEIRDGMQIDWDAPIKMDDGIVLRADIFRPLGDGKYPVMRRRNWFSPTRKMFSGSKPRRSSASITASVRAFGVAKPSPESVLKVELDEFDENQLARVARLGREKLGECGRSIFPCSGECLQVFAHPGPQSGRGIRSSVE